MSTTNILDELSDTSSESSESSEEDCSNTSRKIVSDEVIEQIWALNKAGKRTEAESLLSKYIDLDSINPASMLWIVNNNPIVSHAGENIETGLFNSILNHGFKEKLWNLLEFSLPPYLDIQYFQIFPSSSSPSKNFAEICSYLLIWIEVYSLQHLNFIFKHQKQLEQFQSLKKNSVVKVETWKRNSDGVIRAIKLSFNGNLMSSPLEEDICADASEFLLERCILMQLPWKSVLLHQWLAAALSQVLLFEQESMELRHWPLPAEIVPVAKILLDLVRTLKERVMLGFAILNEQTVSYPKTNKKHPEYIMDVVVLPSIPVLKFLLNKEAQEMLKNLKQISWSTNEIKSKHDLIFLPLESFYLDSPLSSLHHKFAYNLYLWSSENIPPLFPLAPDTIENIVERINKHKPQVPKYSKPVFDISTKPMSLEEKTLLQIMETNIKSSKLGIEERLKLVVKIITEEVVEKGKVVGVSTEDVENKFGCARSKRLAREIFDEKKTDDVHHAIRQALMFNKTCQLLIGCDKHQSVASQLISLQVFVLQQEQLARLANTCALMFKTSPIIEEQEHCDETTNCDKMCEKLTKVLQKMNEPNQREQFWQEFPDLWTCNYENQILETTPENVKKLVKFLNRIANISYHCTKNNFNVISNGGNKFPELSTVFYILPCVTYAACQLCFLDNDYIIFLSYIDHVISYYEELVSKWLGEKHQVTDIYKKNKKVKTIEQEITNVFNCSQQKIAGAALYQRFKIILINVSILKFKEITNCFIESVCRILFDYLIEWPFNIVKLIIPSLGNVGFIEIISRWQDFTLKLLFQFFEIALKHFNVPNPQDEYKLYPKFGYFYFLTCVLSELEVVSEIAATNTKVDESFLDKMNTLSKNIDSDYTVFITINSATAKDIPRLDKLIQKHVQDYYDYYELLKQFRKKHGPINSHEFHHLSYCKVYPRIDKAIDFYLDGNLFALDNMLMSIFNSLKKEEQTEVPQAPDEEEKKCRQCGKPETTRKLLACDKCVQDKYPDVNYFCGRRCQEARWKAEHMAEHLEFELGLSEFTPLTSNVDSETADLEAKLEHDLGLGEFYKPPHEK